MFKATNRLKEIAKKEVAKLKSDFELSKIDKPKDTIQEQLILLSRYREHIKKLENKLTGQLTLEFKTMNRSDYFIDNVVNVQYMINNSQEGELIDRFRDSVFNFGGPNLAKDIYKNPASYDTVSTVPSYQAGYHIPYKQYNNDLAHNYRLKIDLTPIRESIYKYDRIKNISILNINNLDTLILFLRSLQDYTDEMNNRENNPLYTILKGYESDIELFLKYISNNKKLLSKLLIKYPKFADREYILNDDKWNKYCKDFASSNSDTQLQIIQNYIKTKDHNQSLHQSSTSKKAINTTIENANKNVDLSEQKEIKEDDIYTPLLRNINDQIDIVSFNSSEDNENEYLLQESKNERAQQNIASSSQSQLETIIVSNKDNLDNEQVNTVDDNTKDIYSILDNHPYLGLSNIETESIQDDEKDPNIRQLVDELAPTIWKNQNYLNIESMPESKSSEKNSELSDDILMRFNDLKNNSKFINREKNAHNFNINESSRIIKSDNNKDKNKKKIIAL